MVGWQKGDWAEDVDGVLWRVVAATPSGRTALAEDARSRSRLIERHNEHIYTKAKPRCLSCKGDSWLGDADCPRCKGTGVEP